MATLLLGAVGGALGAAAGGSFLGLPAALLGRAAGSVIGAAIDQRVLGLGSAPVEHGRVHAFRVMGSGEGAAVPRVFGRYRVGGHLIWSSRFLETVHTKGGGGKGSSAGPAVKSYSYSVSFAVALCEGEVSRVGRIWADGKLLDLSGITWRFCPGDETQMPDPLITAIEGAAQTPGYRGTAYLVFENLALADFGNRIPQISAEVFRRPQPVGSNLPADPAMKIQAVSLIPGSGEYALATTRVRMSEGKGKSRLVNGNNSSGLSDLELSLEQLHGEVPSCGSASLVVSWFGNDLRCDRCRVEPSVEQNAQDADNMAWSVSGASRAGAKTVSQAQGRPVFGGTPCDASVLEAIAKLKADGIAVMFYPFVLMDIQAGNGLNDPWTGAADQPTVPWRGRITLSTAPGQAGSPDKTAAAAGEVSAFFGQAAVADFAVSGQGVAYTGPAEWSYRRFILHYAHLCALAGGVEAFCIGSELRSLTQIRDGAAGFPAVAALRQLAGDVRAVLGPGVKIGYAADWSEYFGYHPQDGSGDVFFHLDPLWADPAIDFIGIDNYMPLSDWRDGGGLDGASAASIYDLDYLRGNVAGGEGYDWFYADDAARDAQARTPIADTAYGQDWVFRYKDLRNWWSQQHFDRPGGVMDATPTVWVPQSKPIRFTEIGCPAVDKGTNQPNVFIDPKSDESGLPHYSDGSQDDVIQTRYLQAVISYWEEATNNPVSGVYGGPMVDMSKAHVWSWDTRPWPFFPDFADVWSDGGNHGRGHWISGRIANAGLDRLVAEICERSNLPDHDVRGLNGSVKGFAQENGESARQGLQPLMLAYAADAFDLGGSVAFRHRSGDVVRQLDPNWLAVEGEEAAITAERATEAELPRRVRAGFVRGGEEYRRGTAAAVYPGTTEPGVSHTDLPIVLSAGEAEAITERWLSEARIGRDTVSLALPPSQVSFSPGDVVSLPSASRDLLYRIDRVEEMGLLRIEGVRIEAGVYGAAKAYESAPSGQSFQASASVYAEFLDLPLLSGSEIPHAPHVAATASPWPGPVAVFASASDSGYLLKDTIQAPSPMGVTLSDLPPARPGRWMPGAGVIVRLDSGTLQSRTEEEVLNGANIAAIRSGGTGNWEVFQFRDAVLTGTDTYQLQTLLRGQAGTDADVSGLWPAGSDFVLLDGAAVQVDLGIASRGLDRHYRVGPASLPYDDPAYVHHVEAFAGIGLRPLSPVHLKALRQTDGAVSMGWIRRTRIDGDNWTGTDVPLGESAESYLLRLLTPQGDVLREVTVGSATYDYTAAEQAIDGAVAPFDIEVAQISSSFGPGPFTRMTFNG
ncbi:MAG: glycoside hydrolase TIM-barrel-like domain-containing protein [Paracoccaceae bacterium]